MMNEHCLKPYINQFQSDKFVVSLQLVDFSKYLRDLYFFQLFVYVLLTPNLDLDYFFFLSCPYKYR